MNIKEIYLDSHASTVVDQDVLSAMYPYFTKFYGNGIHRAGRKSVSAMEKARFQVSQLIGAKPTEIIFTSGATEAINLGLMGLVENNITERDHIITQRTEHVAVLECIEQLKLKGYKVSILDVDEVGRIDIDQLQQEINEKTLVVAIMMANNEIGTVQPVKQIGKICREAGSKFFCDITQGMGWHQIDVDNLNIDLASMSAHKIYGPRGIGALFIRRNPRISIKPMFFGGGQEMGYRPGTANIPGIVGFGKACEILDVNGIQIFDKVKSLRDQLQAYLFNSIEAIELNGCSKNRHPGNLNLAIPLITGEDLMGALPNIIFSTGSACSSGSGKPSHVLLAISNRDKIRKNSFRLGLGKFNTYDEIELVGQKLVEIVKKLQEKRIQKEGVIYAR